MASHVRIYNIKRIEKKIRRYERNYRKPLVKKILKRREIEDTLWPEDGLPADAIIYLVKAAKNLKPRQIANVIKQVWPKETSRNQESNDKEVKKVKVNKSKP